MELEEAKERLLFMKSQLDELIKRNAEIDDSGIDDETASAIDTVIAELFAMQNLLDEKNEELDRLQRENDLAKKALIVNSYEADERNNLLVKIQELQKENEKLKEIDLTTVHIKGVCDEKERWRNKIREKIEEIKEEDLELRETDSEGDIVTKCEQRAVLNILQDLLKEE